MELIHELREDPLTGELCVIRTDRRLERGGAPVVPQVSPVPRDHVIHEVDRGFARPNRQPVLIVESAGESLGWGAVGPLGADEVLVHDPGLVVVRDRLRDLTQDTRLRFRSWTWDGGAWQRHERPTSRILCAHRLPPRWQACENRQRAGYSIPDLSKHESESGRQILVEEWGMAGFCSAPRSPGECWFLPSSPSSFGAIDDATLCRIVESINLVLTGLVKAWGPIAWRLQLIDAPTASGQSLSWHMRLTPELVPRYCREVADFAVCPELPSVTAERFRALLR